MKKVTDIKLAEFYGVSRETLRNYRNGTVEKIRVYEAMKNFYYKKHLTLDEFIELLRKESEV